MSRGAVLCGSGLLAAVATIVAGSPDASGLLKELAWVGAAISGFCLLCLLESDIGAS